jgi:hypothetical protein
MTLAQMTQALMTPTPKFLKKINLTGASPVPLVGIEKFAVQTDMIVHTLTHLCL